MGINDELDYDALDGKFKTKGLRSLTVNVQVFGKLAGEILSGLQVSLELPEVSEQFRARHISVYDNSGVTDVSAQLEESTEERASMDLFVYVPVEGVSGVGSIDGVEVLQL